MNTDLKTDLLDVTALRVHDGRNTLLITFDKSEVEELVERRERGFTASETFVEEVSYGEVGKWHRELERLARGITFSDLSRAFTDIKGNTISEEMFGILYMRRIHTSQVYGAVASIEGYPRALKIASA